MDIVLENLAKRFRYEWIFQKLDYTFSTGENYAITGPNGSGKSTFLKIISGHLTPTKGKRTYLREGKDVSIDDVYAHISFGAPYIDIIEEFTVMEALSFHRQFKYMRYKNDKMVELLQLPSSGDKLIKYYSSGMKQRLKLLLAICSEAPVLLLDEPTTNLDKKGMHWYHGMLERFGNRRTIIIASNVEADFELCQHYINLVDYKFEKEKR